MADDIRAHANYIPYSPQKVRLVIDLVRGKDITEALDMLRFVQNGAARPISKVLSSAMSNAEENFGVSRDDLFCFARERVLMVVGDIGKYRSATKFERSNNGS